MYQIVKADHFLLNRFNLVGIDTYDWSYSLSIFLRCTYYYVATANLIKVISESADSAIYGIRIPTCLVFQSFTFNGVSAK